MKKKLKLLVFCAVFILFLQVCNYLYIPTPFFYNEEKNSYNVLYFGSSYSYCTFNPSIIDDEEIHSYNLASPMQTIPMTYYVMRDALKYQNSDIVVVETSYFIHDIPYPELGVLASTVDKMRLSRDKIELIINNSPWKQWLELLIPISRLHSEPKQIRDFADQKEKDATRGYAAFEGVVPIERPSDEIIYDETIANIPAKNLKYLNKMIDLANKKGIQLLFVKAPMPIEDKRILNQVELIAEENDIPYIDYTELYEEIGLDFTTDILDGNHLNVNGGTKVSTHLKNVLKEYLEE